MSASSSYTCTIRVEEAFMEGGYWMFTSQDLPGLLLCGKDKHFLRDDVPAVIKMLFRENYSMEVEVRRVEAVSAIARRTPEQYLEAPRVWAATPLPLAA